MPVTLRHLDAAVEFFRERAFSDFGWPCAEPHASAFVADATLLFQQRNHRLGNVLVELSAVCVFDSADVPCEFNRRHLHAETKAEKWNFVLARVTRRVDFSFHAARAKPAGNQDTRHILQLASDAALK